MIFLKSLKNLTKIKIQKINFLYKPHCGEEKTWNEDFKISKIINKYKNIYGPYPADSAFKKFEKNTLFFVHLS